MDGGASAIISLAKFGWTIYNYGFSEVYSPERIYAQFGRELAGVARYIELVAEVYPQALEAAYDDQSLDSRGASAIGDRIKQLVQDEVHELHLVFNECQRQLRRPDSFYTNGTNFIKRIIWNADTHSLVENLRVQLGRQKQAVADILDTLNAQLQVNASRVDPRFDSERVQRELDAIEIPSFLAFQFSMGLPLGPALVLNDQYETTNEVWLRAIRAHLSHSTLQLTPDSTQTPQRYVNLLKAQWMLRQLRHHQTLEYAGKTSPIDKRVHKLELRVYGQLTRPDFVRHSEASVGSLGSSALTLWKEVFEESPAAIAANPDDLLQVNLRAPPEYQNLQLVVRRYGYDGKAVQLMRSRTRHNTRNLFYDEPQIIDQDNAIIMPLYAIPETTEHRLTVDVRRRGEREGFEYKFSKPEHFYQFLWTLTNHKVAIEAQNVSLHLGKTVHKGRVEIWLYDPEPYDPDYGDDENGKSATPTESDRCSVANSYASTAGTLIPDRKAASIAPSSRSTRTVGSNATLIAATPTNKPLLILCYKRGNRFAYICLKLRSHVYVDESSCDCSDPKKRCHLLVIRSSSKDKNVEVMLSRLPKNDGKDSDILQSLSLFARASVQEREHDILAKEDRYFTKEKFRYLTLEFRRVDELVEFRKGIRLALAISKEPENNRALVAKRAKHLENKPRLGSLRERMISPEISPTSPTMSFLSPSRASTSRSQSIVSAPELHELSTSEPAHNGRLFGFAELDARSQHSLDSRVESLSPIVSNGPHSRSERAYSFQSTMSSADTHNARLGQVNGLDLSNLHLFELPANEIWSPSASGFAELSGESVQNRSNNHPNPTLGGFSQIAELSAVESPTSDRSMSSNGPHASIFTLTPPPSIDLQEPTETVDDAQCGRCLFYRLPCASLNPTIGRKRCCYQCYWANRQTPDDIHCVMPCSTPVGSINHKSLLEEQRSVYEASKEDCIKDDGTMNAAALRRLRLETFGELDADMSDCSDCRELEAPRPADKFQESDIKVPESARRPTLGVNGKGRRAT